MPRRCCAKITAVHRPAIAAFPALQPLALTIAVVLGGAAYAAEPPVDALPRGGKIKQGDASILQRDSGLVIEQRSQRLITDWDSFDIGRDASVTFVQPNADASALNRIHSVNPSQIFGQLKANGKIYLVNAQGIIFGRDAQVNVGSLVASTLSLSEQDYLNDTLTFHDGDSTAIGRIENYGQLAATVGGTVALLSEQVINHGTITSPSGQIYLAAGQTVSLDLTERTGLSIDVSAGSLNALVENHDALIAPGGQVVLTARGVDALTQSVVNNHGLIEASSLTEQGGRVILEGDRISLTSESTINATGASAGGDILIGGDWQGGANQERRVFSDPNAVRQATTVTMESGATIDASAIDNGDGGTVVLWSDITNPNSITTASGSIYAKGGANGGDGGQIETSGQLLNIDDISVNTEAADGSAGDWLLDPGTITITTSGSAQIPNSSVGPSGSITIHPDTISTALNSNNVVIYTGASGNINVNSPITYTGSNKRTLTFKANNFIDVNANIISTNNRLNLIFWNNINYNSARVYINGATINTNGGIFYVSGGAEETVSDGSFGTVTVGAGASANYDDWGRGVRIYNNASINTDRALSALDGPIYINGRSHNTGVNCSSCSNYAVLIEDGATLNSGSANITITGTVAGYYKQASAVAILGGSTILQTTSGDILINGEIENQFNTSNWTHAVLLQTSTSSENITLKTVSGKIDIVGNYNVPATWNPTNDSSGIKLSGYNISIISQTGNINITGYNAEPTPSVKDNAIQINQVDATNEAFLIGYDGINPYSGNITISGDSIWIPDESITSSNSKTNIRTTGSIVIQPTSDSFTFLRTGNSEQTLNFSQFDFGTTATSFVLGKLSNTKNISLDNALNIDGSISVYGGNIIVSKDLASLSSGSNILLKASGLGSGLSNTNGYIQLTSLVDLTTNGGDIILWSNAASRNSGTANNQIELIGSNKLISGGGKIVLAGGLDNKLADGVTDGSDGIPDGYAYRGGQVGGAIDIKTNISLLSGGGDVIIRSQQNGSHAAFFAGSGLTIDSGIGTITIDAKNTNNHGMDWGAGNFVVTSSSNAETAIHIRGETTGDWAGFLANFDANANHSLIQTTASSGGGIKIEGLNGGANYALWLGNNDADSTLQILSKAGDISLIANSQIYLRNQKVYLGNRKDAASINGVMPISEASSSDIIIRADYVNEGINDKIYIETTGGFTFEPYSNAWATGDIGGQFDWSGSLTNDQYIGTSDAGWIIVNAVSALTGLTLGKDGMGSAVRTYTPWSINGPVRMYGINVTIGDDITSVAAGQSILLKASNRIILDVGKSIVTNGGDITLWANSDGETTTGGFITIANGITLDSRSLADRNANNGTADDTAGGAITLGGGTSSTTLANGTIVPTGYALKATGNQVGGIEFGSSGNAGIELISGGGDIVLRGKSTTGYTGDTGLESNGILLHGGIIIDAGASGNITLDGQGQNGNWNAGIYTSYQLLAGNTEIRTVDGNILLTGKSLGGGALGNRGLIFTNNASGSVTIEARGTGGISIIGDSGISGSELIDIYTYKTVNFLAASSSITLEARGNGSFYIADEVTLGSKLGTNVTTSTSNILILDNDLAFGASADLNINTAGTVTIEPYGDDFSAILSTDKIDFSSVITSLTIGKISGADGASDATVSLDTAINIAGPLTVYGSNINVSADLSVTTDDALTLLASKDIVASTGTDLSTQGGNILLSSNTDGADGGAILMTGASVTSSGGNITLGGGNTAGSEYAEGSSFAAIGQRYRGMWIDQTIIDASGDSANGNIVLRGTGWQTAGSSFTVHPAGNGDYAIGVDITVGTEIKTGGAGTILINGVGGINNNASSHAAGINFFHGVKISTDTGAITLSGTAGSGLGRDPSGILMDGGATTSVYSNSGAITLTGIGGATDTGIKFKAGFNLGWDGSGSGGSSDITLTADSMSFVSGFTVKTSGALVVESDNDSFSAALNWPPSNLTIGSTLGTLRIGKETNTADITIGSAQTVAGAITVYGGNIAVNDNLNTTAGAAHGDTLLKASGNITLASDKSIITNAGDVILWSDSDDNGAGSITLLSGSAISTSGGNVWIGGGAASANAWNGITVGDGYAMAAAGFSLPGSSAIFKNGISLYQATVDSAGGHIAIFGKSENQSGGNQGYMGVYLEQSTITSGTGNISVDAISTGSDNDGSWHYGLLMSTFVDGTTASITSSSGAITINAETDFSEETHGSGVGLYSFGNAASVVKIETTTGAITVTGSLNSVGYDNQYGGIYLYGSGQEMIVSQTGAISLTGTSANANVAGINVHPGNTSSRIGFDGVNPYTGDITLESNTRINFEGAIVARGLRLLGSSVTYTLENTDNDVDTLAANVSSLVYADTDGVTIGSVGGTDGVTVAGAVAITAQSVTVTAALTSTATGDITLLGTSGVGKSIDIQSTGGIFKTGGTGTATLKGAGWVNSGAITATGTGVSLNVVLWSDYDNSNNDGGVTIAGAVSTNGGHFWAGGSNSANGNSTWNGLTVGDGPSIGTSGFNENALQLFANVITSGGDALLWAGDGAPRAGIFANPTTATSLNVGSGDLILITDWIWGSTPSISATTTGHLYLVPHDGAWPDYSSTAAFIWDHNDPDGDGNPANLNMAGQLENLALVNYQGIGAITIGRYTGMTGVILGNTQNIEIRDPIKLTGPVTIYGADITINAPITATGDAIILSGSGTVSDGTNGYLVASELGLLDGAVNLDHSSNNISTIAGSGLDSLTFVNANGFTVGAVNPTGLAVNGDLELTATTGVIRLDESINVGTSLLTFNAAVELGANITLVGGTVTFDSTVNGSQTLTITGNADFFAQIGDTAPLSSLSISGESLISDNITTTGDQTYSDTVTIAGDVTLTGATVNFVSTVDGLANNTQALTIVGDVNIDADIGVSSSLASFNVSGTTSLGGNVTTGGAQSYSAATTLIGSRTLTGAAIDLDAVSLGANTLTLSEAASGSINGVVSGTGGLTLTGAGTVTMLANGTYTGATAITNASATLVIAYNAPTTSSSNFNGPGSLVIEPSAQDFISAFNPSTAGFVFASTLGSLTIGKASSADGTSDAAVMIASALSINGPITVYGGAITLDGSLDTSSGLADGDVSITGSGSITLKSDKTISTDGGEVTLISNNGLTTGGGILLESGAGISTDGATISLGSASNYASGDVSATVVSVTRAGGVVLAGSNTLNAGSAAVSIYGEATGTTNTYGIFANDTTITGSDITLIGKGSAANTSGHDTGVELLDSSSISASGTLIITGTSFGTAAVPNRGLAIIASANSASQIATTGSAVMQLNGVSGGGNNANTVGIFMNGADVQATAGGDIELTGTSNATGQSGVGIYLLAQDTLANSITTTGSGAITLTGTGSAAGTSNAYGIWLRANYSSNTISTDSGTLTINGSKGSGTGGQGIVLTTQVLVGSATPLNAIGDATQSGAITLNADAMSFTTANGTANNQINTSGAVTFAPISASFSSAQTIPSSNLTIASRSTGLVIGKVGNSAAVSIESATTISGDIRIYSNDISVAAALTATDSVIHFIGTVADDGNGSLENTAAGAISADQLVVRNLHSTLLHNHDNISVNKVASDGGSSFLLDNTQALTIATVAGVAGISATDTIGISTLSGNLTITDDVTISGSGSTAISLNAGASAAAGTAAGGDIVLSASIDPGVNGVARLFTGNLNSTGLESAVGSGSGNFRYNADESTDFSTVAWANLPSSGIIAMYREQPAVSGTIASQTITYGDALPTFTLDNPSGLQFGDAVGEVTVVNGALSTAQKIQASGTAYTVTATGLAALGYDISGVTDGELTVNTKALDISGLTASNKTYDALLGATLTGAETLTDGAVAANDGLFVSTDQVSLTGTAVGNFADKNVGSGKTVTVSGLSLTGADASNYSLNSYTVTADITPKTVSLSAAKTYDASTDLTGLVSIGGLVGSETLTYSGATASDAHVATANKFINAITLGDGSNGGLASNYTVPDLTAYSAANNSVSISAATLTPTLTNSGVTKVYDGTTTIVAADTPVWSFSGLVSGDSDAVLAYSGVAYNSKDVATASQVTVSGLSIDSISGSNGSAASDYVLSTSSATVAASITPAALTVVVNNDAKFVTQADTVGYAGVSYVGFVGGENANTADGFVAPSITRTGGNTVAGSYSGVLVASGAAADNYSISYSAGDYTIVASDQLLVRVNNVSDTYGSATQYSIASVEYYNGSAVVRLDDNSVAGAGVSIDANNQVSVQDGAAGSASFTLAPLVAATSTAGHLVVGSYQLGTSGVVAVNSDNFSNTITVVGWHQVNTKAISASASGVSKTYDGTTSMNGVSLSLTGLESGDVIVVDGLGAFGQKDAGTSLSYTVSNLTLSGTDAANYHLSGGSSFTGNDGVIAARQLTLSASKTYDGTNVLDAGEITFGNLVGSETLTYTGATVNDKHVATANKFINAITLGDGSNGGLASNYSVPDLTAYSAANNSVSISAATLTPTLTNSGVTKVYDGTTTSGITPTYSVVGLVSGDTAASLTHSSAVYNDNNVATANKVTVSGLAISAISGSNGSQATDYVLDATSKDVVATISKATLTVTADNQSRVYGDSNPTFSQTISGFVNGEDATSAGISGTATGSTTATVTSDVGNAYVITGSTGNFAAANYDFTAVNGVLTITARPITVIADGNQSKIYGEADGALTYTVAADGVGSSRGLANGDSLTGTLARASGEDVNSYAITQGTVTNATNSNYAITYTGANFSITQRAISLTANSVSMIYGETEPTLRVTVGNVASNEGVASTDSLADITGTLSRELGDNVGSYDIVLGSGSKAGNYSITFVSDNDAFSITPRSVTLSASRVYDGTTDLSGVVTIGNLVGSETLTYTGATVNDKHVATANKFINAITLGDGSNGGLASNYTVPDLTAYSATHNSVSISAATLTPTLTNSGVSKVYDGTTTIVAADTPVWSFSGLVSGDSDAVLAYSGVSYNSKDVATASQVTVSGLSIDSISGSNGSAASDYVLSTSSATVAASITPAALTVVVNNDAKFVTQADTVGYAGVSYVGFVGGENANTAGGFVAPSITRTGGNTVAGTYTGVLVASGAAADNYSISYSAGDYTIVPSDQLLVRVTPVANLYGDTTQYQIASAEYFDGTSVVRLDDNSVAGASVSIDANNEVSVQDGAAGSARFTLAADGGVYSSANQLVVGAYQLASSGTVTVNSDNFNDIITVIGSHSVNAKGISALASGVSKTYDGSTSMTGVSLSLNGVESGDVVAVNGLGAFAQKEVGTNLGYSISNLQLSGADSANYYLTSGSGFSGSNGVITPRVLSLTASKTYDGNTVLAAGEITFGNLVGSETLTYTAATVHDKHVATAANFVSAITLADGSNGGLASNYQLPTLNADNAAATITPALLSYTLSNTGVSKVYDGSTATDLVPSYNVSGLVAGDTLATLTHSSAVYNASTVAAANTISVSGIALSAITGSNGSQLSDYVLATSSADVAASITPAVLTITADNQSRVYGEANPVFSQTISGFVNNETLLTAGVTGSAQGSSTTTVTSDVGANYVIVASRGDLAAANYRFTAVDGRLSITPRPLTLTIAAENKVYDGNAIATLVMSDNRVNNDDLSISYRALFDNKNVGSNKPVSISDLAISGAKAANYSLTGATSMTATAAITRLNSVSWIGGTTGNWFDPANWAGGAVPDLSNVANVVIPEGVTVSFNNTATSPATAASTLANAVNIESLGSAGSLSQTEGFLNIGSGGMTLTGYTQSGGTLSNGGSTTVAALNQSGGSFSGTGEIFVDEFNQTGGIVTGGTHFTVRNNFNQTGDGTLTVAGNIDITDTSDGIVLGNLASGGSTSISSTAGAITQAAGTRLDVSGTAEFIASTEQTPPRYFDVTLNATNNRFADTVTVRGAGVSVSASGDLDIDVSAANDAIIVASGSLTARLAVNGNGTLAGGTGVSVSGTVADLTISSAGTTRLADLRVAGDLVLDSAQALSVVGDLTITGAQRLRVDGKAFSFFTLPVIEYRDAKGWVQLLNEVSVQLAEPVATVTSRDNTVVIDMAQHSNSAAELVMPN